MDVFDVSVLDILKQDIEPKGDEIDKDAIKVLESVSAARRKQKPRMKLDTDRLLGKMGLVELDKQLKNFVFKGKGHEATDITKLIDIYKVWSQQMISIMNFDDCIEKIEDLGHKKIVKDTIKRYRNGLGLDGLTSEYVTDQASDNENIPNDRFDNESFGNMEMDMNDFDDVEQSESFMEYQLDDSTDISVELQNTQTTNHVYSSEISEEQLSRIEENRKRALEKLKASRERNALNNVL